jgi:WD40 repeat protein
VANAILRDISAYLKANRTRLARGSRGLLEAFATLTADAKAPRIDKERLRSELSKREGKEINAAGLRQRLKRLNDVLLQDNATFELAGSGGQVTAQPTGAADAKRDSDRVGDALAEFSGEKTLVDLGGIVEPMATPESETLWVFFSFAMLNAEEQRIQDEFYERLKEKLAYPTAEFVGLPKIQIWRDIQDIAKTDRGEPQMDGACERAFLGLLMVSDRYPHRRLCQREAGFFLAPKGRNRKGKFCLVVGVNIEQGQMPPRFTAGTRIVHFGRAGNHLVEVWSEGTAATRLDYVNKVAAEIFKAAKAFHTAKATADRDNGVVRTGTAGGIGTAPRRKSMDIERFEQFVRERKYQHDVGDLVDPRAEAGLISREITLQATGTARPDGVPIVEHLINWAGSTPPPRLVAVLGEFGMGKTVTCQKFTQDLLALRDDNPALPLPIYFDLRDVGRINEDSHFNLETLLDQMLSKPGTDAPSGREVIAYVKERAAIVIFDGLDEITNKLPHEAAIRLYRELLAIVPAEYWRADSEQRRLLRNRKAAPKATGGPRLIVSCRTHYFRDVAAQRGFLTNMERAPLEADKDIAAYFMLPFTGEQIEAYLKLHLGDQEGMRAIALIDETYNLRELAGRPILLRFIRETIGQIEREKLGGRPINLARLYDILVDQVLERDNPKHIIPVPEKRRILQALALVMHARGQNSIANERLDEWFQTYALTAPRIAPALKGADALSLSEIFAQDLRNASLLVRPGEDTFQFAHTSVREYFLANALHAAIIDGSGETAWHIQPPTPETLEFILQRHAIQKEFDRKQFEAGLPRLLAPGRSLETRRLAFWLWRLAYAKGMPLPRPDIIDLSGMDLRQETFAGTSGRLFPLARSRWHGAQLHQAEFRDVDLSQADFSQAEAPMSRWLSCRLDGGIFDHADLTGALWRQCAIPGSALQVAMLDAARAFDCVLAGITWRPQARVEKGTADWRVYAHRGGATSAIAVASCGGRDVVVSGGYDNTIRVRDLASGQQIAVLEGHQDGVISVAVASRGGKDLVVSGGDDSTIRVHDLASGQQIAVMAGHQDGVISVAVASRDGRDIVISGGADNTIRVYDLALGRQIATLEGHQGPVDSVAVASCGDNDLVVSGGDDGTIRMHNLASGQQIAVLGYYQGPINSVAVASRGGDNLVVSGGDDGTTRVYDLASGRQIAVLERLLGPVKSVAVASCDGKSVVASGGDDNTIRVHDLISGQQIATLEGHHRGVRSVAVASRGGKDVVVSGGDDNTIRVHDLASGQQIATLEGHQYRDMSVAVAARGGKGVVVSGGDDNTMRVHDLASGQQIAVLEGHKGLVSSVTVASRRGKDIVVSGSYDNTIRAHDLTSGQQIAVLEGHQRGVMSVAVASRGGKEVVVSGSYDNTIRVHDLASGQLIAVFEGHKDPVSSVAVASHGGREVVVSGGYDNTIRVHDLASGQQIAVLEGYQRPVMSIAVASRGGKDVVVSSGDDDTIRVHDLASGQQIVVLEGHKNWVSSVAVASRGGKEIVASGGYDNTIRVHDLASGQQIAVFNQYPVSIGGVAVASDREKTIVISGRSDGVIEFLHLAPETLDVTSKLYVHRATGAFVRLRPQASGGDVVVDASPDAWRYWSAAYRIRGGTFVTDLDNMPRIG